MKSKGEIITCVTTEADYDAHWKYLTKGKEYEVIDSYEYCYTIIDDTGSEYSFPIENFHTIQELREIKLNKLGINE